MTNDARNIDFRTYLLRNLIDSGLVDRAEKDMMFRARRTALILGGTLVIALIAVVFAFVQDTKLNEQLRKKSKLEEELNVCVQEAQKQQALATESMLILNEVNKMAAEQLRACQAKK